MKELYNRLSMLKLNSESDGVSIDFEEIEAILTAFSFKKTETKLNKLSELEDTATKIQSVFRGR